MRSTAGPVGDLAMDVPQPPTQESGREKEDQKTLHFKRVDGACYCTPPHAAAPTFDELLSGSIIQNAQEPTTSWEGR
jgi:hypothetical protein